MKLSNCKSAIKNIWSIVCLFWFSHKPNASLFINKIKNIYSKSITCFASYFSKTAPKVIKAITTGLGIFIKRVVFSLFIAAIFLTIFFFWVTYPNWVHNVFNNFSEFSNSKSFNSIFELYCHYYEEIPSWIRDIVNFIPDTQSYLNSDSKVEDKSFSNFGTNFGTFGDSFGALNTLFSGFAFAGIIISIFLQSKELKATRDEVEAQRKEFEKQTAVFNKQTFENTFFQMLQQHNELIKSINIKKDNDIVYGRVAIQEYYQRFEQVRFNGDQFDENYKGLSSDIEKYTVFCHYDSPQLKICFKSIYQILKFVNVKEENKEIDNGHLYTNILRAQLSDNELVLLFLNCLSEELGSDKFQPLVEHYAFFEHLSPKHIKSTIAEEDIIKYKLEAYGTTNSDYIAKWKQKQRTQSSSQLSNSQ